MWCSGSLHWVQTQFGVAGQSARRPLTTPRLSGFREKKLNIASKTTGRKATRNRTSETVRCRRAICPGQVQPGSSMASEGFKSPGLRRRGSPRRSARRRRDTPLYHGSHSLPSRSTAMSKQVPSLPPSTGFFSNFAHPAAVWASALSGSEAHETAMSSNPTSSDGTMNFSGWDPAGFANSRCNERDADAMQSHVILQFLVENGEHSGSHSYTIGHRSSPSTHVPVSSRVR